MKLSPQQTQLIDYLNDGEWHCMVSADFYMKDDRTRISELRAKGYTFQEEPCDSRAKCKVAHNARLYMRRLLSAPTKTIQQAQLVDGRAIMRDVVINV